MKSARELRALSISIIIISSLELKFSTALISEHRLLASRHKRQKFDDKVRSI